MMDMLTVLVLLIVGFVLVKKRLLPRLKEGRQEKAAAQDTAGAPDGSTAPDFRVLSFCSGDFTYADDLAHCVEFELKNTVHGIEAAGGRLAGDPFPVAVGDVMLLLVLYHAGKTEEVEG